MEIRAKVARGHRLSKKSSEPAQDKAQFRVQPPACRGCSSHRGEKKVGGADKYIGHAAPQRDDWPPPAGGQFRNYELPTPLKRDRIAIIPLTRCRIRFKFTCDYADATTASSVCAFPLPSQDSFNRLFTILCPFTRARVPLSCAK